MLAGESRKIQLRIVWWRYAATATTIVTENCKWFLCIWRLATLLSPDKLWSKYLLAPAHLDSAEQEWFLEIFPQTLFKLLFKNIGAISTWPDCDRLDIVGILIKNLKKKYFQ